ncbi:MAG: phosphoglycerate kinase [Verrucomicrobiales bacterium]
MPKKTIRDIDVSGKRCLVRVDFNVPVEEKGGHMAVTDDTRIRESLPTISYLRERGAIVILMSHLGRPKSGPDDKLSLRYVGDHLHTLIGHPVVFSHDVIGAIPEKIIGHLRPGDVALLENLRFHPGEEKNDPSFARELAKIGDIYVNDAFGTAHRAHASTEGVARLLPVAVAGLLMEKELAYLHDELQSPERPFLVILGGAKVSDKIQVIDRLIDKADVILIGGGMAYTFQLAQGQKIGNSLSEPEKIAIARSALEKARRRGIKFLLPVDNLIVENLNFDGRKVSPGKFTRPGEEIPDGWEGVDIGPESIKLFRDEIAKAKTILWNGPMGVFEIEECAKGTFAIAEAIAKNSTAKSVIGGGDSVKAVKNAGVTDKVTFISTGGGASLELLEGKELPGVAALNDK